MTTRLLFTYCCFITTFFCAQITITTPVNISICDSDNNGFETIKFSDYNSKFSTNPSYTFSYFLSSNNAEDNVNALNDSQNLTGSYNFFVRVESPGQNFVIGNLSILLYANCSMTVSEVSNEKIQISPNPVLDVVRIKTDSKLKNADIISLSGEKIMSSESENINLSKLTSGVYILKVFTDKSEQSFRIIKK